VALGGVRREGEAAAACSPEERARRQWWSTRALAAARSRGIFLNVSTRAAKFIDKRENGQETHTAQFVGKPGETLNNGNATPKAPQHIQDVGKRNTRNA
jgi:hypothetical protein